MRKKKGIILIVFSLITLLSLITIHATEVNNNSKIIRVGTSGTYYPFTFVEGDQPQGFEIDVWDEIGHRLGYDIEYKNASFSGLFGMLDSDKIDVIANQITITEERSKKYYFSNPYVVSGAQIVVAKDSSVQIHSFEDLQGKRVGVDLGSNYEQILKAKNSRGEIITYQSTDTAFNDLMIGRIDAVVIDKISALINIQEKNLPLALAGDTFEKVENAFVFAKNDRNQKLVSEVNQVLTQMTDEGTLQQISNKWLNTDVSAKNESNFVGDLLRAVLSGVKVTLLLSIISIIIGLITGILIAVIRYLRVRGIEQILSVYVAFFRGTPLLVQLFLLYFGLPQIFHGLKGMGGFTATYIALGLNASAYIAEVLRGSFQSIDKGQMEACLTIGMQPIQAIKRILLPQVMRMSIPAIGNIYIDIVKGSSLAFTIGVAEMLAKAQMVASTNYKFFESYIVVAIVYWILIEIFNYIQKLIEKKMARY